MSVEPIEKKLSRTDVGESETHQSGILIPVKEGERLFPAPMGRDGGTYFRCQDHMGHVWTFRFFHKAKDNESRITPTTQYMQQYRIRSDDIIKLYPPDKDAELYRIEFVRAHAPTILGEESLEGVSEGAVRTIRVNRYERDSHNRKAAISKHGIRCFGCHREMFEMYGEIARGYTHIHHIKPLSEGERTPKIDDLVPMCPNCHAIVHLENPPLTIDRIKELIKEQKKQQF